jgi:hypothetical protein
LNNGSRWRWVWVIGLLVGFEVHPLLASADGPPPHDHASPAARQLGGGNASEYWDLSVELALNYKIMVRFLITNQGPGTRNGIAVGHVISPNGDITHFRNGRLSNRWTLSEDGLDLDIGKSHLDLHPPRYKLKVNKSDAKIRLSFAPNVLHRLPKKLTKKDYRIDLLALGAATHGTIQLSAMTEPLPITGWATLTHTIAKRGETSLALRRIELISQRGEIPVYIADFLDPAGKRSSWLGYLEPGCEQANEAVQATEVEPNPGTPVQKSLGSSDPSCLRRVVERTVFDLSLGDAIQPRSKGGGKQPYWIPLTLTLKGKDVGGRVLLAERFLQHDPLDDLPGPIRFLAGLSTKPRRVWSVANFEVTIPPSLNSKPIQFQGHGVATVSFLNPVTRP